MTEPRTFQPNVTRFEVGFPQPRVAGEVELWSAPATLRPQNLTDVLPKPRVPVDTPTTRSKQVSLRPYQWRIAITDLACAVLAVVTTYLIWELAARDTFHNVLACAGLVSVWMLLLGLAGSYDVRRIGRGLTEYRRVVTAGITAFALVVMTAFLLHNHLSRGYVLIVFTLGISTMLMGRFAWRRWLLRRRARGEYQHQTLVLGEKDQLADVTRMLQADGASEYRIVDTIATPVRREDLPAWLDAQIDGLGPRGIDMVALATSGNDPELVQAVTWRLEGPGIGLIVSPALGRLVGSRITVRSAAGVPFLALEEPRLLSSQRAVKRFLDILVSLGLIIVLAPVMLVAAVAVRLSGPGQVLYVRQRVGQGGRLFKFPKFRTMEPGSDKLRSTVIGAPDTDISRRYRDDPRITPVGRLLRRWSLDELPQLFNVLTGSMSLVGPRPMLPDEVELLAGVDHRRHIAKSGLTGLWQVNGRKDTTWEERMNLDLEYIENWSPILDLIIIARTATAIISARGSY